MRLEEAGKEDEREGGGGRRMDDGVKEVAIRS